MAPIECKIALAIRQVAAGTFYGDRIDIILKDTLVIIEPEIVYRIWGTVRQIPTFKPRIQRRLNKLESTNSLVADLIAVRVFIEFNPNPVTPGQVDEGAEIQLKIPVGTGWHRGFLIDQLRIFGTPSLGNPYPNRSAFKRRSV